MSHWDRLVYPVSHARWSGFMGILVPTVRTVGVLDLHQGAPSFSLIQEQARPSGNDDT